MGKDASSGDTLTSDGEVILATPTLYDFPLYQSARADGKLEYSFDLPAGLYSVRMKFAEMWLDKAGKRPMDIEINGKLFYSNFDPFTVAGGKCKSIDVRAEDITPDKHGRVTIKIRAKGSEAAVIQAIEVQ